MNSYTLLCFVCLMSLAGPFVCEANEKDEDENLDEILDIQRRTTEEPSSEMAKQMFLDDLTKVTTEILTSEEVANLLKLKNFIANANNQPRQREMAFDIPREAIEKGVWDSHLTMRPKILCYSFKSAIYPSMDGYREVIHDRNLLDSLDERTLDWIQIVGICKQISKFKL